MHSSSFSQRGLTRSLQAVRQNLVDVHRYLFIVVRLAVLVFLTTGTLSFSVVSALAKGSNQVVSQGLILQVDRANSSDVTFSVLDRHGKAVTFHLLPSTKFAAHQSASQLTVNQFVAVQAKPNATGGLDATRVQLQKRNQAPFSVLGVIASVDLGQKSLTLALSDGTMLTIKITHASLKSVQAGALISLQAHFDANGSLVASTYHVVTAHAGQFQARGIISHTNARLHRLTLVTPSGASFTIVQGRTSRYASSLNKSTLHVGEKVDIKGSTDSHGNLDEQSVAVERANEQQMTLGGIVAAIDSTANTFSLIDEAGNIVLLNANPSLLASIHVGGVYEVEATIAADGSLTAVKIEATLGDDQGETLTLEGTVQTYDANSGLLSLVGDNGENFTLQVISQTKISADDGASATLTSGQAIEASVQPNSDGSYTALTIKIQENAKQGEEMTFAGTLLSYDGSSGQLTISSGQSQTFAFATNSQTEVKGADSLDALPVGTFLKIEAQVQQDGSYVALKVEVSDDQGNDHSEVR